MEKNNETNGLQLVTFTAEEINQAAKELADLQKETRTAASAVVQKALVFGSMLASKKKEVGHGNWEKWVAESCEFSLESAALYIRLASNPQRVTDFIAENPDASLRATASMLAYHRLEQRAAEKGLTVKEMKSLQDSKTKVPAVYKAVDAFWSWIKTTPVSAWGEVERETFLSDLARRNDLARRQGWEIPEADGEIIEIEAEVLS